MIPMIESLLIDGGATAIIVIMLLDLRSRVVRLEGICNGKETAKKGSS